MRNYKSSGSAHVIVIIVLVVAILGALGYVYWKNFIAKSNSDQKNAQTTSQKLSQKPSNAATEVDASYGKIKLIFGDLPEGWKVETTLPNKDSIADAKMTTITSPSGRIGIYAMVGEPYQDGACPPNKTTAINRYPTKIKGLELVEVTGQSLLDSNSYSVWPYVMWANGATKDLKLGDDPCVVFANQYFMADGTEYAYGKEQMAARVTIAPNSQFSDTGEIIDEMSARDMLQLDEYKTARQIVESLHD